MWTKSLEVCEVEAKVVQRGRKAGPGGPAQTVKGEETKRRGKCWGKSVTRGTLVCWVTPVGRDEYIDQKHGLVPQNKSGWWSCVGA
jgi:hypothetical protein